MQAIGSQNELRLGRISLRTRAMRQFTIGQNLKATRLDNSAMP